MDYKTYKPDVKERELRPGLLGMLGAVASGKSTAALDKAAEHLRESETNQVVWVDYEGAATSVIDRMWIRHSLQLLECKDRFGFFHAVPGDPLESYLQAAPALFKPNTSRLLVIDGFRLPPIGLVGNLFDELEAFAAENEAKVLLTTQTNREPLGNVHVVR